MKIGSDITGKIQDDDVITHIKVEEWGGPFLCSEENKCLLKNVGLEKPDNLVHQEDPSADGGMNRQMVERSGRERWRLLVGVIKSQMQHKWPWDWLIYLPLFLVTQIATNINTWTYFFVYENLNICLIDFYFFRFVANKVF